MGRTHGGEHCGGEGLFLHLSQGQSALTWSVKGDGNLDHLAKVVFSRSLLCNDPPPPLPTTHSLAIPTLFSGNQSLSPALLKGGQTVVFTSP